MKQAKFGVALVATAALVLSASPAMASVDTYSISTATKKKPKKKAAPVYYATMNDGTRAQCTIVGTAGSNKIQGTPGNDVICGLGGNDKIYGNGGNDFIDGGTGNDLLVGGEGDDLVSGANGTDKIDGGNGDDVVNGGSGNDTLTGSTGIDEVVGEDGNDKVIGGTGDDLLQGGAGKDSLTGEDGNDELDGGVGKDIVIGGAGLNTCVRDTADRGPTGCYFDNSDPTVTDMWTDPAVVDTSTGPQTFNVYVQLHDETGGFGIYSVWSSSNISLNFSRLTDDGNGHTMFTNANFVNGQVTVASCSKVERMAATQSWMMRPIGCRVGGDRMDPLIRVTYTLPQYASPGTYQVTNLGVTDAANNRVNFQYRQCDNCTNYSDPTTKWIQDIPALGRAKILQAGPGDVTPPNIQSVTYTNSVSTASGDQIVEAIVTATDDYGFSSGNQWNSVVNLGLMHSTYLDPTQTGQIPPNVNINGQAASIMCDQQPAQNFNYGMQQGCQISPGVFKVKVKFPQSAEDGNYQLTNINISDGAGNNKSYSTCFRCQGVLPERPGGVNSEWLTNVATSGQIIKTGYVALNRGSAPRLVSFNVDTPGVSSAGSDVQAIMTVVVHDDEGFGAQWASVSMGFSRISNAMNGQVWGSVNSMTTMNNQTMHMPSCSEFTNMGGMSNQMGCIRSSSGGDYVLQIPIRLPAHAASGTYLFTNMTLNDGINSVNIVNGETTMRMPNSATIEGILGFRPSFVNSY